MANMVEDERGKKSRRVEDMKNEVKRKVVEDLAVMKESVVDALHGEKGDDGETLQEKIATVKAMISDYAEGVQAWRRKATLAVVDIEGRQRRLKNLVHEATTRAQQRKEEFVEGQAKRERETAARCSEIMSSLPI